MEINRYNSRGRYTGLWVGKHPNGELSYKNQWVDGVLQGYCENYDIEGKIRYRGSFKKGESIGFQFRGAKMSI